MSRNTIFQVCLLLVLVAIAVGIWTSRMSSSKITGDSALFDASRFQTGQPSTSSAQVLSGKPSDLLEAIKNGEEHPIRLALQEAMRTRNTSYIIELYRLACKHGTMKALREMHRMPLPLSKEEQQQIFDGMNDLLARQQYDAVRYIMTQNKSYGLADDALSQWIGDQFASEPWERARMEAVMPTGLSFQGTSELPVRMIQASLTGSEDRFEWLCKHLVAIPNNSAQVSVNMLAKSKTIDASNVSRILQLSKSWGDTVDKSELFDACLPFLGAEHADVIRTTMQKATPTKQLLNYIVKYDAPNISTWSVRNRTFELELHTQFQKAIMSESGGEELERFEPIKNFLVRDCTEKPQWDVFNREHIPFTSSIQWLWKHGFRPRDNENLALRLYLAIRCQDHAYLENLLNREKRALPNLLNEGFSLRDISAVKDNNDQRILPLLLAIEFADMTTVQMLVETKRHNWKTWSFESPLVVALRANKSDVYRYLGTVGVTENTGMSQPAAQPKTADGPAGAVVVDVRDLRNIKTASKVLMRVVEAGDLASLEKVLANFPYRAPITSQPMDFDSQLEAYQRSMESWRYDPDLRTAFEKSVAYPKLFARLQAEGFAIDMPILLAIVRGGHDEVLEMALRDMNARKLVSSNYPQLDDAAQVWPKVMRVLTDSAVTPY